MPLIDIAAGNTRATVAPEAGGRLLQLEIRDGDAWLPLLLAPGDPEALVSEPLAWGCYPMTPWPGRVANARFAWEGREYPLPANDGPHSIHGAGVYAPWSVEDASAATCRLRLDFGSAWPFPAYAVHEIAASADSIRLRLELHAAREAAFPAGAGWHPWFRRDVRPGRQPRITLDAAEVYETAPDLIPTGSLLQVAGETDLRAGPALGSRRLDCCYRGRSEAIAVRWGDIELVMECSRNLGHTVVYTPQRGFCVEPQTCVPDAFNLAARGIEGTGLAVVRPGAPLIAETTWRWRRTEASDRA